MTLDQRLIALVIAGVSAGVVHTSGDVDVQRHVYFTASAKGGTYVTDLTAADIEVTEGGRAREVLRVEASPDRLKVCLGVDESLAPDASLRQSLFRFAEHLQSRGAEVSLYLLGAGSVRLLDYTTSPARLSEAISVLPRRAQGGVQMIQALHQLAGQQRQVEGRRAMVILATETAERLTMTADGLLNVLRDSNAVMHVITLAGTPGLITPITPDMAHLEMVDEVERDRALNDGPKQTGGLRLVAMRVDDYPVWLNRVRGELLNEYLLTYVVRSGTKSDGRLSISSKRPGISIRGPRQVPKLPS
jgi:hypothetical protein